MADYFQVKGNYTEAIKYLNKALELSDNPYYKNKLEELKAKSKF